MKKSAPLKEKQRPPEKAHPLENLPPLTKSVTWDTVWLGWEGGANKRIPERRFALGQYVITRKDITGTKCPTINTHEQRILARHIVPEQNVCWDTLSQDKMSWNRPSLAGIVPKFLRTPVKVVEWHKWERAHLRWTSSFDWLRFSQHRFHWIKFQLFQFSYIWQNPQKPLFGFGQY